MLSYRCPVGAVVDGVVGLAGDAGPGGGAVGDCGDVVGEPGCDGEVGDAGEAGGMVEAGIIPGGHGVVVVAVADEVVNGGALVDGVVVVPGVVVPGVVPGVDVVAGAVVVVPGVEVAPGVDVAPGVEVVGGVGAVDGGAADVFGTVTLDPTLVTPPPAAVFCAVVEPGAGAAVGPVAGEIGTHPSAPGVVLCAAPAADDGVCAAGWPAVINTAAAARLPAEISFLMCTSFLLSASRSRE